MQQQQGILLSQRSQLAHDCLEWGIRPACGPATVGQSNKKQRLYRLRPSPPCNFVFFDLMYDMQVPN